MCMRLASAAGFFAYIRAVYTVKTVVLRLSTVDKVLKLWSLAGSCSELSNFVLEIGGDELRIGARFKS